MVASILSSPTHAAVFLLVIGRRLAASAFQIPIMSHREANNAGCPPIRMGDGDGPDYVGDKVLYSDDDVLTPERKGGSRPAMSRWDSLNPKIKNRIVKEAQERAIRNKKRREPASERKRRLYDQYREMQVQSRRDRHVERATPVNSRARSKLSDITPGGGVLRGRVISLTKFGAYVDVNTEVDGLLHVSQITRDELVDHPRAYLSPGDDVEVRVVRVDPESKKLQLTMLPEEILEEESVMKKHEANNDDEDDRIQLDEIEVDDELWGEIRRVTDYGAYVEIGAVCRGFLHFMDHPVFGEVKGSHPKEYMRVGDRVRVWVMDVERTQMRIKLTANRPAGLPGPRREVQWI
ncbi:hypothetical protein ACHAXA_007796 [Cyclostephanos tholiformis]|uniref:S1 motif domain-containing protein n=1 Tax=Cyclostephanos tholiformis TaxID=382380 RepID=A0ABD3R2J8_9STRA